MSTISEKIIIESLETLICFVKGSPQKQQKIVELYGVERFVKFLGFPNAGVQAKACQVIFHLVSECPMNLVPFWEGGAVDLLTGLLQVGDASVKIPCRMALFELMDGCGSESAAEDEHAKIFSKESLEAYKLVVQSFVRLLSCDVDFMKWTVEQRKAAEDMVKVSAVKSEGHIDVCSQLAADAICQLLQFPDAMVQQQAAAAIVVFCHFPEPVNCQVAFRVAGCVPLLRGMLSSPSTDMQWANAAIELLRDRTQDSCVHAASIEHLRSVGGVAITRHRGGGFAAPDYTLQFDVFNTFVADIRLCGGCFYFEVEIFTMNMPSQLGVCTHEFQPCGAAQGKLVGDDASSYGVCGRLLQKLHGGKRSVFGSRWSVGDTIGFALDMRIERAAIMSVSVNGSFAAPNGAAFKDISAQYLSPAFSGSCDRCRLNLGDRPFAHAPPDDGVYVSVHDFHRRKAEKESTQHVKQCLIS